MEHHSAIVIKEKIPFNKINLLTPFQNFLILYLKMKKDLKQTCLKIKKFIKDSVASFKKDGVILGLSGGIDSTVVAFLSVRALGKNKVFGLIMPEKESAPENVKDAEKVASLLGIKYQKIDLTPLLTEIGVYKLTPKMIGRKFWLKQAARLFKRKMKVSMIHSLGTLGLTTPDKVSQIATAIILPKLRLRSLFLHYLGALKNLLVLGTLNKTEYLLGHYDKYGDGACHIEPIRELYKTQVKEIAKFLGVPKNIIEKPATHDLFAGTILTDEFLMGLSFEKIDTILIGLEQGKETEKLSQELEIEIKTIEEVKKAITNEKLRRKMPLSPKL